MKSKSLLTRVPRSTQNPLLSQRKFSGYCKSRFRHMDVEEDVRWLLAFYEEEDLLLPTYLHNGKGYYSTFQVYNLYLLERRRAGLLRPSAPIAVGGKTVEFPLLNWRDALRRSKGILSDMIEDFNALLRLLVQIQDVYLPEVRGNLRVGSHRDYRGHVAIGDSYFVVETEVLLSSLRERRSRRVTGRNFRPEKILSRCGLTSDDLERWTMKIAVDLSGLDPLKDWHLLLSYVDYDKRQRLKGDALLAEDFHEIVCMLLLFLKDLDKDLSQKGIFEAFDWIDVSGRDKETKLPAWKAERYGLEAMTKRPYEMLEFLTNEYGINPRPKAIIFTEGNEWRAMSRLFDAYCLDPNLLGIEFRSLRGEGHFKLCNWQCFIEYMHEKQVLIFFVLDNEGGVAQQARRLLGAKRKFEFPGLTRVIPSEDRILIWGATGNRGSFEEANFGNAEIRNAISRQTGRLLATEKIRKIRRNADREKGLVAAIENDQDLRLDKTKLDLDLVECLIHKIASGRKRRKTPLEEFVLKTGPLVLLNYPPTGRSHRENGLKTGLFG